MIPTAEDFFELHIQRGVNNTHSEYLKIAIKFAKSHCEKQAKVISEKAKTMNDPNSYCGNTGSEYPPDVVVDKDSILNAYSLDLIE